MLQIALAGENSDVVRAALMEAVPTFHNPEVVNIAAAQAEEMQMVSGNDRKLVKV